MDGDVPGPASKIDLATKARNRQRLASKRKDGRCPEGNDQTRVHKRQFLIQPPTIMPDLPCCRLLMDPTLASLHELEMLDGICEIRPVAVDARLRHGAIEQLTSRPDKRAPLVVFLI